jgi:hypothetical protein
MKEKHRRLRTKAVYGSIQQKSLENMIKRELVLNYGYDNKLAIAESLAARIMELFNTYAPDRDQIKPFQVLWMAVDQYDPPGQGKTIAETACKTVVVDLWTDEELQELADGRRKSGLLPQRAARITKQALSQEAVFTQTDVALIMGVSVATVRKAIDQWQNETGEILPLRGTVHDIGMTFSHKRQIVQLHLQGHLTSEIARVTHHDPVNVDRYIQDFERVLEFARENAPIYKICFYTGMSERLVKEYLAIVKEQDLLSGQNENQS